MGWSWVRVSTGTSQKLRDCMEGKASAVEWAAEFENCVGTIVGGAGGENAIVRFEPNGRWARVGFDWNDAQARNAVVYDLEGREVVDLLSAHELDGVRTREQPTTT